MHQRAAQVTSHKSQVTKKATELVALSDGALLIRPMKIKKPEKELLLASCLLPLVSCNYSSESACHPPPSAWNSAVMVFRRRSLLSR